MTGDRDSAEVGDERTTCSFCDSNSDYVLTVSDPCPWPDEQVIDGDNPMPVCHDCLQQVKS